MKENTTSKERLLKKIRKALLERRDNPYPNLEDQPLYAPALEIPEVIFAEQFTAVSGQFVFCEDEVQFIESLLTLAEANSWRKIYCWEKPLQDILNTYEYPFFETDKDFELFKKNRLKKKIPKIVSRTSDSLRKKWTCALPIQRAA